LRSRSGAAPVAAVPSGPRAGYHPALRPFGWLLLKEFRELAASRAFWLLLLIIGPLAGHGFITAVETYAEASGIHGGPAALAQGLSPLDGIFVPSFGAYDLAATLLFPFVAIRLISAEKSSGAWKLMLQSPASMPSMLLAKGVALLGGWMIAWIPGLLAVALWKLYSGSVYFPELGNLLLGHLLRVILACGVAVAAAAVAGNAASAAIATLGFTVGTWALEFVAAGRGGLLEKIASYTPTSALRIFEQGEFRLNTVLVTLLLGVAGFTIAAVWLQPRRTVFRQASATLAVVLTFAAAIAAISFLHPSWDLSENRRNSFPPADEAALARIREPLRITVNLAPEDPRLLDLDQEILSKLVRVVPHVEIDYAGRSRTGLFEGSQEHYGEIWYRLGARQVMSHSTTPEIVLETIYNLAGIAPPSHAGEIPYQGHPLAAEPAGAAWIFYLLWPLVVMIGGWIQFHERS